MHLRLLESLRECTEVERDQAGWGEVSLAMLGTCRDAQWNSPLRVPEPEGLSRLLMVPKASSVGGIYIPNIHIHSSAPKSRISTMVPAPRIQHVVICHSNPGSFGGCRIELDWHLDRCRDLGVTQPQLCPTAHPKVPFVTV